MSQVDNNIVETVMVLPNGPDVLGVVNDHVVTNLRGGSASNMVMLSTFRMAKLLVEEPVPLTLLVSPVKP